jgi:hypothetical protein
MNLEEIRRGFASDDPQDQCVAMEKAKRCFEQIAEDAVGALKRGPHSYLIAERLGWLGSFCMKPLGKVLEDSPDSTGDVEALAALVLFDLGDHRGIGHLLRAVETGKSGSCLAAMRLSQKRIEGTKEAIRHRLERCPLENEDEIASLVFSLRDLEGALPENLEVKFKERATSSWALKALWPELFRKPRQNASR